MDEGEATALTLSTAFDTIDHATLTNKLSDWYEISNLVFFLFEKNKH